MLKAYNIGLLCHVENLHWTIVLNLVLTNLDA
jgi:hypothetical protein